MSSKIKPSMITSLLLTTLLVFSFNIRGVAAGIPLAPKTPTQTPTPTLTRTPTPTRTNTATSTPITHTVTASATPGPAMKLTALNPHPDAGLHTSYVYDNSPTIGVSTNDIYISLQVSGTTTSTGAFSPATIYPSIKNNRSSTLLFYWSAYYTESGIPEMVESSFGTDFSGSWTETGSGTISANGTWTPDVGILQLVASSCHNCPYTLNTTIHFSTVSGGSPYTPTATSTPTLTPTATFTPTNTLVPGTPQANGTGTCWASGASWPNYDVLYKIDSSVPADWNDSIYEAAFAWNAVSPSGFQFRDTPIGGYVIDKGPVANPGYVALTLVYSSNSILTGMSTTFNEAQNWDPSHLPASTSHSVRNIMTHEFGHWLYLKDILTPGCEDATMWYAVPTEGAGETKKESLETPDIDGINYQYP